MTGIKIVSVEEVTEETLARDELPEYLKKEELTSQQISEFNKSCSACICNKNHQKIHNDVLRRAWILTQERIKKAILEMEKKNHEVQVRNKESGKYQEGFAYGIANAKAFIKEVFK